MQDLSKRLLFVPMAAVLLQSLSACSTASFSGTAPSRATGQTPQTPGNLSCSIAPAAVKKGDSALVAVTADADVKELFQLIISPLGESSVRLVLKDGVWMKEDGTPNNLTGEAEGSYAVSLKKTAAQSTADATCSLTVSNTPVGSVDPTDPTVPTDPTEPCSDGKRTIGADIAFLIDNSNSNAVTDCPAAKKAGVFNGVDLYECQDQTNREKAVNAAYELLATIAAKESDNPLARSKFAVASFPSASDYVTGWTDQSKGWIDVTAENRGKMNSVMAFSRKPSGLTPYMAAMTGATKAFEKASDDGRMKVAVLVTDGEPTDSDPSKVEAQAEALRSDGVKVITIYVTGSETRGTRISRHTTMMKDIDDSRFAQSGRHWFAAKYASFTDYMTALVGSGTKPGLVSKITSRSVESCKDTAAGLCAREVYEVQKSESLKDAFMHVIRTQAIRCEG